MENPKDKMSLKDYLDFAGILTCNSNPYLPSLIDLGYAWSDATALIDSHDLFYCKAYRKRTTYLSRQAYFLLKQCRTRKPLGIESIQIYENLKNIGISDMETLRSMTGMEAKIFTKAFDFLLENLNITAYKNGKVLNPYWSTFLYCTAETWEKSVETPPANDDAGIELKTILLRTMPEKAYKLLTK